MLKGCEDIEIVGQVSSVRAGVRLAPELQLGGADGAAVARPPSPGSYAEDPVRSAGDTGGR